MRWVTSAVDLLICPKRYWFSKQPEFDWLRKPASEAQVLGIVSHQLSQEISEGKFDQFADDRLANKVESRWNSLLLVQYRKLVSESIFGSPSSTFRWRYFIQKQNALIEKALNRRKHRGVEGTNRNSQNEEWLISERLQLKGRVDRIEFTQSGVRIVDFKTTIPRSKEIPDGYRKQIILYAGLYRELFGETPYEGSIEWQDQSRSRFKITDVEIDETLDVLEKVNVQNLGINTAATAEYTKCRWCLYRTKCEDYLRVSNDSWRDHNLFVIGTVTRVENSLRDQAIVVNPTKCIPSHDGEVTITRIPLQLSILKGRQVVFDDLRKITPEGTFATKWNTRFSSDLGT